MVIENLQAREQNENQKIIKTLGKLKQGWDLAFGGVGVKVLSLTR